ncbi:MAG: hypothetical protein HPY53_03510 [Brevinematales bacterium]|nr:hypothetical protein [Brevinematales bacterium]
MRNCISFPPRDSKGKWGKNLITPNVIYGWEGATVKYSIKSGALYHVKFKDFFGQWGSVESVELGKYNPLKVACHAAYNTNYIPQNPGLGYFEKNPWGIKYDTSKDTLQPLHTKIDIYNYYQKLPKRAETTTWFDVQPEVYVKNGFNLNPGKIAKKSFEDGLVWINYYRWLVGLNSDIQCSDKQNNLAQHGAFILQYANDVTSTKPKKAPQITDEQYEMGLQGLAHANVAYGCSLEDFVTSLRWWIGYYNQCSSETVGDREWIISPYLGEVGFGMAGSYSVLSFGESNPGAKFEQKAVCFPAPGLFPHEFLIGYKEGEPWTVTVNPKYYKTPNINQVTVKLTRLYDNMVIVLDKSHNKASACGPYLNVKLNFGGMPNSIMFRPDFTQANYADGQVYRVEISGLEGADGTPETLSYTVEFFNLD